jgi:DNA mismatch repair ATPase MutS
MSARNDLLNLYREWSKLTEAEGLAIRSASWPEVQHYQDAKYQLQAQIVSATELVHAELALDPRQSQEVNREFRSLLAELIQLEQRNSQWLAEQRQNAEAEMAVVNQSSRNLRQVHKAYNKACGAAAWNSYS